MPRGSKIEIMQFSYQSVFYAQLGLPDKGREIEELVICYVVRKGSLKIMGLRKVRGTGSSLRKGLLFFFFFLVQIYLTNCLIA